MINRILIAEDNPINQKVAVMMLKRCGYENIDIVGDGDEAVRACTTHDYKLVLMDCQMPKMDGLQASKQIRMLDKAQPVIIAVTAHAFEQNRRECMDNGMDDYLSKPFTMQQLLEKVKAHVI